MRYFITGTDTDCGKTLITLALMQLSIDAGLRTAGFKPVAAGAQSTAQGPRNDDALALQAASNLALAYPQVNPYCFAPPIAPHIAARQAGVKVRFETLAQALRELEQQADNVFIEGAGGWRVPLNAHQDMADLCVHLDAAVILVAEARLGWINHTLLSIESILQRGVNCAGWIVNQRRPQKMSHFQDNIKALEERIPAPLLGIVPHVKHSSQACRYLGLPGKS